MIVYILERISRYLDSSETDDKTEKLMDAMECIEN